MTKIVKSAVLKGGAPVPELNNDVPNTPVSDAKEALYLSQVDMLYTLLRTGAITPAQFNKSFSCMTEKMGMEAVAAAHGFREV